jgi:hypothetical protein
VSVECQHCSRKSELFLCATCITELHRMLADMPWWLDRLAETSIGQARLGEPARRGHRSGLEKYANPKPSTDGLEGTEGQRLLEQDLADDKLRVRLLAQGGVNAKASDLFDEVQNMLGSWVRDVCERRGVDVPTIGTASAMAIWLRERVSALASAECAEESFRDVQRATEDMERAVNRPPLPKTCGPCPTPGEHTEKGFVMADVRAKCGTRLEAKPTAVEVRCPTCKQTHNIEVLTDRLTNDLHYMSFTIRELLDVVLPRGDESIPRRTLYDWAAKGKLKATGEDVDGTPKYLLADVRKLRSQYVRKTPGHAVAS